MKANKIVGLKKTEACHEHSLPFLFVLNSLQIIYFLDYSNEPKNLIKNHTTDD